MVESRQSSAEAMSHRGFDRFLGVFLGLTAVLLLAGWTLPLMTVETLFIFDDQITIIGALVRLLENGERALFVLVGLFTVVIPTVKLAMALLVWWRVGRGDPWLARYSGLMERAGKWSMLDVFVVAIIVVIIKVSLVSDVTLHAGLYIFCTAVLASMLVVARITTLARRALSRTKRPAANPGA